VGVAAGKGAEAPSVGEGHRQNYRTGEHQDQGTASHGTIDWIPVFWIGMGQFLCSWFRARRIAAIRVACRGQIAIAEGSGRRGRWPVA